MSARHGSGDDDGLGETLTLEVGGGALSYLLDGFVHGDTAVECLLDGGVGA
jgi:hypothetical protein